MKILICGDSWSEGYGVNPNEAWPNFLDANFVNVSKCGASNSDIVDQFLRNYNNTFDVVIVGWSGVTRFKENNKIIDFSSVDNDTIEFFKDKTLTDLLSTWDKYIKIIISNCSVPLIQYNVFGDKPLNYYPGFLEKGCLEYLANKNNIFFKHEIPIFEFDWLNKTNYKLTKKFGYKFFNKDWEKACVEREQIRPSENFLICGHPSKNGHKLWSNCIKGVLNDIFNK